MVNPVPLSFHAAVRKNVHSITTDANANRWIPASEMRPALVVTDGRLLRNLIIAFGFVLRRLAVGELSTRDVSWIEALRRRPCNLVELKLYDVGDSFPLKDVLLCCRRLEQLSLAFNSPPEYCRLEELVEHVPHLKMLYLFGLNSKGGFKHIWARLPLLEELHIFANVQRHVSSPALFMNWYYGYEISDFYDGIALPLSRLQALSLRIWHPTDWLRVTLLCSALGARLRRLDLYAFDSVDGRVHLSEIRASCPNVAVRITYSSFRFAFRAMGALRESLRFFYIRRVIETNFATMRHELDDAAFCTRLRSIRLTLTASNAEEFLEVLLSYVGPHLEQLNLGIIDNERAEGAHPTYLGPLTRHTGNLRHLSFTNLAPPTSLRFVAIANPRLYDVILAGDMDDESEEWLTTLFSDFLSNCHELVDIAFEHLKSDPICGRIAELDAMCASLGARRKVGVRVANTFYEV